MVILHGFLKKRQKTPDEALARKRVMSKRATKKAGIGSAFDDFLKDEGTYEVTQAVAIKGVLAWQIEKAMKGSGSPRRRWPGGWIPAGASSTGASTRTATP